MDPHTIKRRLSCILAADAVGYSAHMGRDEVGTVRVLAAHRAVIDGIIAFHEGRIVGTAGDSVLAEFSSVVEAVRCAVEIQEAIKTRNDSLPPAQQMSFRVGINLGDVVVRENDLLGDGINVAARLETLAEPGGICISSGVYDQITGKLDLGFEDIGEQNLKNIMRPIRVYRISGARPAAMSSEFASPAALPSQARDARQAAPSSGRWMLGVGSAAGAVLVAGLAAWQAGWLRVGNPVPAVSQPAAPAASPAVAAPAQSPASPPPTAVAAPSASTPSSAGATPLPSKAPGIADTVASPAPAPGATPPATRIQPTAKAPDDDEGGIRTPPARVAPPREFAGRTGDSEFSRARAEAFANRAKSMRGESVGTPPGATDNTMVWRQRSGQQPIEPRRR
mgnify:CR=1 FL=1